MFSEFSCNLLETLSLPPWKTAQDWDLYVTRTWEKRIPFSSYVRPITGSPVNGLLEQATACFDFTTLPDELQLRVLGFCPATTLFQLMHVSLMLRLEASKIFWACSDAYFLVDAGWLLEGGYPGYQCWDLTFLSNVQHVEVAYEPSTNNKICSRLNGKTKIRQDRIDTFWGSINRHFPRVKSVIITQNGEAGIWKGNEAVPQPLQLLMRACPLIVQLSVLVPERQPSGAPTSTTTWQQSQYWIASRNITKRKRTHHKTILPPIRQDSGLVSEFERLWSRCVRVQLQRYSLWPLAIEALDRYYFDHGESKPFTCPLPGCDTYFEKAGEWSTHAARSHYQHTSQFHLLPSKIRALLEERDQAIARSEEEARTQFRIIKHKWNIAGKDKRRDVERVWADTLKHYYLWDAKELVAENPVWIKFVTWTSLENESD